MVMVGGKKVGGYLSLMGGFLLHLTLGTLYCFGNMNTYMTSYLRTHVKGHVRPLKLKLEMIESIISLRRICGTLMPSGYQHWPHWVRDSS